MAKNKFKREKSLDALKFLFLITASSYSIILSNIAGVLVILAVFVFVFVLNNLLLLG